MSDVAWARFAESVGRACQQLANDLRAQGATMASTVDALEPMPALGKRQKQILDLFQDDSGRELTTREIAEAIGVDTANTWSTLRRIEAMGLVLLIPGSRPQRWRLSDLGRLLVESLEPSVHAEGA